MNERQGLEENARQEQELRLLQFLLQYVNGNTPERNGHNSQEEYRMLMESLYKDDGSSPIDILQCEIATEIYKLMKLARMICPHLSRDVSVMIAAFGICRPKDSCCDCSDNKDIFEFSWLKGEEESLAADGKDTAFSICASCGKPRCAKLQPRIPHYPSSEVSPSIVIGMVLISARISTWKPCRHFHLEETGTLAVRHRLSGFHSFRTMVCNEWVVKGTTLYRVRFQSLRRPFSAVIGVVSPKSNVNSDKAWCPGTRSWKHAWGICVEGSEEGNEFHHHGVRATEEKIELGGTGKKEVINSNALTNLEEGAEFEVMIDATNQIVKIEGPFLHQNAQQETCRAVFQINLEQEGNNIPTEVKVPISPTRSMPLALTVSLKFAGDEALLLPKD